MNLDARPDHRFRTVPEPSNLLAFLSHSSEVGQTTDRLRLKAANDDWGPPLRAVTLKPTRIELREAGTSPLNGSAAGGWDGGLNRLGGQTLSA